MARYKKSYRIEKTSVRAPLVLLGLACMAFIATCMHVPTSDLSSWAPWWGDFEAAIAQSRLWDNEYLTNITTHHQDVLKQELHALLLTVEPFLHESIKMPLRNTTRPYQLQLNCSQPAYDMMFSGEQRVMPRHVVMVVHVMSELHLIRMRYHMYADGLVDTFVISEGTTSHQMHVRKPLVFERAKHLFTPFLHKTLHRVHDDTNVVGGLNALNKQVRLKVDFTGEAAERQAVFDYLTRGNVGVGDEDLIVYGDADEFIDEDYLFHLKHCEFKADAPLPFSSNAPFYQNDFRHAFKTDFPPDSHYMYSLKFPSVWTLKALRQATAKTMRHHMQQAPFPKRVGGFHLSSDAFIPHLLFKYLNNAEGGLWALKGEHEAMSKNMTETYERYRQGLKHWRDRILPPSCLQRLHNDNSQIGPHWLVQQNPEAFPWLFLTDPPFWVDPPHQCLQTQTPPMRKMRL